jgi:uncharacterized protein (DUF952 family)
MIYHITTEGEWKNSSEFFYSPSAFQKEKFIHCCSKEQLKGVLQRYFTGQRNLLLLTLDERKIKALLKYEPSTNNEMYPHIFGEINKDAIVEISLLPNN